MDNSIFIKDSGAVRRLFKLNFACNIYLRKKTRKASHSVRMCDDHLPVKRDTCAFVNNDDNNNRNIGEKIYMHIAYCTSVYLNYVFR
jgi:hypothetical protein